MSKVRVQAGLVPKAVKESAPGPISVYCGFDGSLWSSLAYKYITQSLFSSSRGALLVCMSLFANICFLYGHQSY